MVTNRPNIVLNYIRQKKEVKLRELCALYPDYNQMTLRRDLNLLESNGYIKRVRGGAILCEDSLTEFFTYNSRSISAIEQKRYIAVRAVELLEEKTSVYLDASTTISELAKIIPNIPLFVITNDPTTCFEVQRNENIDIVLTGGTLNKSVISLSGPIALDALDNVNIDTAFIGAAGFSLEHGFTNALYNECELKKKAIKSAIKTIVLIDSSKIGKSLPYTFANLSNIDIIVTDKPLPENIEKEVLAAGIKLIY
jgi:DeoR/GlpR family transcriptional regulator of sugar metabolism